MATIGTVNVRITGDISGLVSQLEAAGLRVEGFDKKLRNVGRGTPALTTQARGFSNLARAFTNAAGTTGVLNSEISILASSVGNVGLVAAGAGVGLGALAAGLGASIASAVNFEAGLTRVAKTANLSKEEAKAFGAEILTMSRRLPVATNDLLRIAEVAGQLGIEGSQIGRFVEEIAKLNSTTGVASETLATGLGTLIQVSGLSIDAVDNISASITNLGNTSNSTEQQILDFATRLIGVTTALGVPVADLLSISSSFAAAGVPVERGGTAIQNILIGITEAADENGDKLALIADVAGLTADEFLKLQASDPGIAFTKFIDGLGDVQNVLPVLQALEIADDRLVASALAAANAQGGLTQPLLDNREAAIKATATNDEFARSAETTAAKFQLLKNNIGAAGIEIGTVFLPAVNLALDGLNGFFNDVSIGNIGPNVQAMADEVETALGLVTEAFDLVTGSIDTMQGHADVAYGVLRNVPGTGPIYALVEAFDSLGLSLGGIPDELPGWMRRGLSGLDPSDFLHFNGIPLGPFLGDNGNGREIIPSSNPGGRVDTERVLGSREDRGLTTTAPGRRTVTIPPGLNPPPKGGGGGGAQGLTALEAAMDGIITRSEALTLGLTDQQVIALELAVAQNRVADEQFRQRIGLQALAQEFPGLNGEQIKFALGLQAIADHLAATGQTINEFILETSTAALEGFQAAFDAIFNKPTKEDAELQLQLDLAKRKKLLAPNASEAQQKAIDAEIQRIQNLINIRRNADDIKKDLATIADQTLLTDAAQEAAAAQYIAAIETTSAAVEAQTGIVYLQTLAAIGLKDQTLDLTTSFAQLNDQVANAAATAPASGLSLQDALIALAALPDGGKSLLPAAALGTGVLPFDMTIRAHRGERILPAFRSGESGQPINVTSYITIEGDATERTVAMIRKAVREEAETTLRRSSFAGSYVTSGAYTPS